MALRALARMYLPRARLFCFTIRRGPDGDLPEGISRRYTATALIGMAGEPDGVVAKVLSGHGPDEVCGNLLGQVEDMQDLGEVALTLWAARTLNHAQAAKALARLHAMDPAGGRWPTVEVAWCLTALAADAASPSDDALARGIADRLLASFNDRSGLFPHRPLDAGGGLLRSHVTCFADFVYPVQALSHYSRACGDRRALDAAARCAERIVSLQGPAGQWWWHYDVRTGRVIEKYPVYAVHQDAMAPMALAALRDAGGPDHSAAADRGLVWLVSPPETGVSLIDMGADLIWRKIARREPWKLSRTAQALASRLHPALRVPLLDALMRPAAVDYESRPYHMGWVVFAV
jgi:hypothetical protein